MIIDRRGFLGALTGAGLWIAMPGRALGEPERPGKAAADGAGTAIEGFRNARFGMSADEVRKAIKKDFGQTDTNISVRGNPVEHTEALVIRVKDLVPRSGPAEVAYILGMTRRRLIQINVVWGKPVAPATDMGALTGIGLALRDYFLGRGPYQEGSMAANRSLPDGSTLVFKAADAKGRVVLIRLLGSTGQSQSGGTPEQGGALLLSYIENPLNPDVFRIENGAF